MAISIVNDVHQQPLLLVQNDGLTRSGIRAFVGELAANVFPEDLLCQWTVNIEVNDVQLIRVGAKEQ